MKTYRYATLMRPPELGACPMEGMVAFSWENGTAPSGRHYQGWCEYNRKLTDTELYEYEMEELPNENV